MGNMTDGPCDTCGRTHVQGAWWPRHPYKPQLPVAEEAPVTVTDKIRISTMAEELLHLDAQLTDARAVATRWQDLAEGRVLAGLQCMMMALDHAGSDGASPHAVARVMAIASDLEHRLIYAGSHGPPLTRQEAAHRCPDDDHAYASCPGCDADPTMAGVSRRPLPAAPSGRSAP